MKPARECDQQERMLRALLVIDGMSFFLEDIMNDVPETPVEHFIHTVYAIAHAGHGICCVDSHWLERIDEMAQLLKDSHKMDLEKILQEIAEGKRPKKKDPTKTLLQAMEESKEKGSMCTG